MSDSAAVEQWFGATDHPQKELMQAVRKAILEADDRVGETIKWKSPTDSHHGSLSR